MAWFFLDTHASGLFTFGFLGKTIELQSGQGRAREMLTQLPSAETLKNAKGICVVAGPGTFSSVRTGVLYANLLARLLKLPLVGVSVKEAEDLPTLYNALEKGEKEVVSYVAPIYDRAPNITLPKHA